MPKYFPRSLQNKYAERTKETVKRNFPFLQLITSMTQLGTYDVLIFTGLAIE
jgi:hypothetical protein